MDAIRFYIESWGGTAAELAAVFGDRATASAILARRQPLTLEMIRRMHTDWGIAADVLI